MLTTPYSDQFHADTLANGGATVDLTKHNLAEPEGRYYVGAGRETWVHKAKVEDFTPAYLAALVLVAKREGREALGTWVRGGVIFTEPTLVYHSRSLATLTARLSGEIAIFDSESRETIYV